MSNAVKFCPPGREAVVEVFGAAGAGEYIYTVRDNGIGFDGRYADKLFRIFEHVNSTRHYEGTGIGLALVKRVVERHGGRVWAEGKVDVGASFHFVLPANPMHTDAHRRTGENLPQVEPDS